MTFGVAPEGKPGFSDQYYPETVETAQPSASFDPEGLFNYEDGSITDPRLIEAARVNTERIMNDENYSDQTEEFKKNLAHEQMISAMKDKVYELAYNSKLAESDEATAAAFAEQAAQDFAEGQFSAAGRGQQAIINNSPESMAV